ncbi:RAMP superfamily CRISPR-associated protein [Nostoc sp. CCY0012]|uniref:RAMP superfamily CRISPR-associated protein n=1 Tax=Nostoc sp. CCY0012 TaxID=1056123 RepID=UPI0039C5E57D
MYQKAYGIIETLAPVHVGASAGEENGNLNLIFRDQFTQTGIINGSSIRGRLRADMRQYRKYLEKQGKTIPPEQNEEFWYGQKAELGQPDSTTEAVIKLEHASIVWLPVFCPGQPIVWVSCPSLLKRYNRIAGLNKVNIHLLKYKASQKLWNSALKSTSESSKFKNKKFLFFNFGFLELQELNCQEKEDLLALFPLGEELPAVIVDDNDMPMIHDMALYRQSRVALDDDMKKAKEGHFFNIEALPEGTILAFPIAIKPHDKNWNWKPIKGELNGEIYLGGLESIGFGNCHLTIKHHPENKLAQQSEKQGQE